MMHLYPNMALPYHLVAGLCRLILLNVQRPVNTSKRGLKNWKVSCKCSHKGVTRYHWNILETRSLHLFLTVGLRIHFVQFQGLTQVSFGFKVDMLCIVFLQIKKRGSDERGRIVQIHTRLGY